MSATLPRSEDLPGPRSTRLEGIDAALSDLSQARGRLARASSRERRDWLAECADGVASVARDWVADACRAKRIPHGSAMAAEEVATGPLSVLRGLHLARTALADIERHGVPRLPGTVHEGPSGRLRVPLLPARGLYDGVLFKGFRAEAWTSPGVRRESIHGDRVAAMASPADRSKIALVLGAGNVSAIPATDTLDKLAHEGKLVLLKMNPVNEYLGPHLERALRPLIDRGLLRIVYGGADVGAYCANHAEVDEVHITGSTAAHEAIVWGPAGQARDERRALGQPLLRKPITSELGNITPWIVVPGPYTREQLAFQAENVAAMIAHNASFNCVALRLIVTWRDWPKRGEFLDLVDAALARVPPRAAYYPGAIERFRRFAPDIRIGDDGRLPWTIVRDVSRERDPRFFTEEAFACVTGETALAAASPESFLDAAVEFVNHQVWGTLAAGLMVHDGFRRAAGNEARLTRAVANLRYGTVGINHWPALGYALMNAPWGGYPGGTLEDPQSGIGWVHNPLAIDQVEKSVIEGPLTLWPKPFWFPSHRHAFRLAEGVVDLYHRPRWWKLGRLALSAARG